jgi:hypothetical protein
MARARPSASVYDAALTPDSILLPGTLRPEGKRNNTNYCPVIKDTDVAENIIANINNIAKLATLFSIIHADQPKCENPDAAIIKHRASGLCVSVKLVCKNRGVETEPLGMSAYSAKTGKCGPAPSALNNSLAIAALKSKMGISDIRYLLASLNIQPPSYRVLQEKMNNTSILITEMNKQSMEANQRLVSAAQESKGKDNSIECEFDCSYNNRPQLGHEAGTQAFFVMIENSSQY